MVHPSSWNYDQSEYNPNTNLRMNIDKQQTLKPRLHQVAKWFYRRRLPYFEHLDSWLHENGFDSEERLKLVHDVEWRKLLQIPYNKCNFRVFKHSISAFRKIPFDELHDWRSETLSKATYCSLWGIGAASKKRHGCQV